MLFSQIIGQHETRKRLIQSVKLERVSHGVLFCGTEGSGKLSLAIAYAQYISCTNRGEEDSCGTCASCVKYQKLVHPDLHFVFPVAKLKANSSPVSDDFLPLWRKFILENKTHALEDWMNAIGTENQQVSIFTSESESILRKLSFKTYESEYKVMIIWLQERMNTVASNKLLKILEEPPAKTLFILVSNEPDQILGTILSRAQMIKIPKIDNQSLFEELNGKFDMPEMDLQSIVKQANGSHNRALAIINSSEENLQNFKYFSEIMRFAYGRKIQETMKWVDVLATIGRENQKSFFMFALKMVRENFAFNIAKQGDDYEFIYLTKGEKSFSEKFSPFINERNIFQISDEFNKAYYHIERNAYGKIVLLDMSLKLMRLLKA